MSPDVDLTVPNIAPNALRARLLNLDSRLFVRAAEWHWPGAERVLPRLSRSANHGVLCLDERRVPDNLSGKAEQF
ncbi:hypothetical protein ACWEN3_42640, partial [Streptomyces sp. NPDC004561]